MHIFLERKNNIFQRENRFSMSMSPFSRGRGPGANNRKQRGSTSGAGRKRVRRQADHPLCCRQWRPGGRSRTAIRPPRAVANAAGATDDPGRSRGTHRLLFFCISTNSDLTGPSDGVDHAGLAVQMYLSVCTARTPKERRAPYPGAQDGTQQ